MTDYLDAKNHKGIYSDGGSVRTCSIFVEDERARKTVRMQPIFKQVTCLAEYFNALKKIHDENKKIAKENECDLFLYRGQANVNWLYMPSILRSKDDIKREHILFKEFHRRFFEKFDFCKTALEEEVLMQHFGIGSRCLDLMENPLIALWAACELDSEEKNKNFFGEVSIWKLNLYDDELKSYDSSTVSVIANTAKQKADEFSLGHIEIEYHKEHPTEMTDFIYIKDILRHTAIVRPKYNNDRIKNQQGAFAIMNLNEMIDENKEFYHKTGVTVQDFQKFVLNRSKNEKEVNIARLRDGTIKMPGANFSKLTSWDLWFKKIAAQESNFVDFFDLYKYLYNKAPNQNVRTRFYIIIPPKAKESIIEELKYLNITTAYIYPEIENVAKEMKKDFGLEKSK